MPFSCRARVSVLLALAAAIAAPAVSSAQQDGYRDSPLDGAWVGAATFGADVVPVVLAINVYSDGGVATLTSIDADGEVVTAEAVVGDVTATSLTLDIADPALPHLTVLALAYRNDATLQGAADGGGIVALQRMSAEAGLQRMWSTSLKIDGKARPLVLQLQEAEAGRGVVPVTGSFWLGGERGEVQGSRTGNRFDLELDDGVAPVVLAGKISRGVQLKGTLGTSRVKLVAAPGKGKPAKLSAPQPAMLSAGASQAVAVRGKNFAPGTLVELEDSRVAVTAVVYRTAKLLDVSLSVDAAIADGTRLGLRALAPDGQSPERRGAFDVEAGAAVSFAADVQPIFSTNCALAGCHTGSGQAGLVLSTGQAYPNLVDVPSSEQPSLRRVQPGDAESSYLVHKIRGDAGISGGRMPLNRAPLSDAEIATIVAWIDQGAGNNRPTR